MSKTPITFLLLLPATLAFVACDDTNCELGSANDLKIQFLSLADSTAFQIDTLTVRADGTDSVLVNRDIKASYITLPLNSTKSSTIYDLEMTMLRSDTLTIHDFDEAGTPIDRDSVVFTPIAHHDRVEVSYTAQQRFTSMDCGLVFKYTLEDGRYTSNFIKSMALTNAEIKESNEQNIVLFF